MQLVYSFFITNLFGCSMLPQTDFEKEKVNIRSTKGTNVEKGEKSESPEKVDKDGSKILKPKDDPSKPTEGGVNSLEQDEKTEIDKNEKIESLETKGIKVPIHSENPEAQKPETQVVDVVKYQEFRLGEIEFKINEQIALDTAQGFSHISVSSDGNLSIISPQGRSVFVRDDIMTVEKSPFEITEGQHQYFVSPDHLWIKTPNSLNRNQKKLSERSFGEIVQDLDVFQFQHTNNITIINGISENYIFFLEEGHLFLLKIKENKFIGEKIPLPSEFATGNTKVYAGQSRNNNLIWVVSGQQVIIIDNEAETSQWHFGSIAIKMPDQVEIESLFLDIDRSMDQLFSIGSHSFVLDTQQNVYSSSVIKLEQEKEHYTWNDNIRTLSEQFCIQCHSGPGGLENENDFIEKKDEIIRRLSAENSSEPWSMPPPLTASANSITKEQKNMIISWLESK